MCSASEVKIEIVFIWFWIESIMDILVTHLFFLANNPLVYYHDWNTIIVLYFSCKNETLSAQKKKRYPVCSWTFHGLHIDKIGMAKDSYWNRILSNLLTSYIYIVNLICVQTLQTCLSFSISVSWYVFPILLY